MKSFGGVWGVPSFSPLLLSRPQLKREQECRGRSPLAGSGAIHFK